MFDNLSPKSSLCTEKASPVHVVVEKEVLIMIKGIPHYCIRVYLSLIGTNYAVTGRSCSSSEAGARTV